MPKLRLFVLFFTFLVIIVKESNGSCTLNLENLMVPAFTPFKKNGDINVEIVTKMAQNYAKNNITNILIGSYAGEGPSMGLYTRQQLVKAWVRAGVPLGQKIIVEVGAIAFLDMLKLVRFCAELEVTAIFVFPELSYKATTVDEVIEDLNAIYKVAPTLPIIFHDLKFVTDPVVSGIEVFIEASSKVPTFCGIATDLESSVELHRLIGPTNDKLIIVIGNDVNAPLALKIGIHLSVWPSLFPELVLQIIAAVNAGDCYKAADLQTKLNDYIVATSKLKGAALIDYASRSFIENQKFAYSFITGLDLNQRRPLLEIDVAVANRIKTCLVGLGLFNF